MVNCQNKLNSPLDLQTDLQDHHILLSSTMRKSDETKKELVKIGAELSIKDGTERSMEDVVKYLFDG